tara:strand:+ start:17941 stop:18723 length:783 start_codon:yes stop_codon:yes gene_type:complete
MNIDEKKNIIINWLKSYSQDSDRIFVVGVSGGIDSALTSTLCAETGIRTMAVSMPIYQQSSQLDRAHAHIAWLKENYENVEDTEIDLTFAFYSFKNMLPGEFKSELGLANTRSRLRMLTLYQVASSIGGLVIGTGNKVEDFGVGFYTKYGDGGVDLSPIADLMKSEVREMASLLGVSQHIITAPPTDGLWEDHRTDEEQIGATYEELEWAMNYIDSYINTETPPAPTTRQQEVLKIYNEFHRTNSHKMRPIPVCTFKEQK